jgi:hypothetical protein
VSSLVVAPTLWDLNPKKRMGRGKPGNWKCALIQLKDEEKYSCGAVPPFS